MIRIRRPRRSRTLLATLGAPALAVAMIGSGLAAAPADGAATSHARPDRQRHVLLLSVDGLHSSDLRWYVREHPGSALAQLVRGGTTYSDARTTFPSDSFPGMVGQVTGGTPGVTGIYYDDTWNRALLPAGTTHCAGATRGTEVDLTEDLDRDKTRLDAGQGLSGLPGSILSMTGHPLSVIDRAKLPVDPRTCRPVLPSSYLRVNTVFDVAHHAGLRTAWSDKHPAYQILNGPDPRAIDDEFTPEINSAATGYAAGDDWTTDNAATQQYDGYKVRAVLNEIAGYDHAGRRRVGEPAVFGMNFQAVSTAQKLPSSDGLTGGYLPGTRTPGPLLRRALDFVDASVGAMETALAARGHAGDTTVILSSKHGQSPVDPRALTRIDDGAIIDAIDHGWAASHPGAKPLVAFAVDDDVMLLWLSDRSPAALDYVRGYLLGHSATGNTVTGASRTLSSSGLRAVDAGAAAARLFGVSVGESRHPDVVGLVQHGVVYTGKKSKIAEHGGDAGDDRDVALVVAGPGAPRGVTVRRAVSTTQIAPTILRLLGLRTTALQAVRVEHTAVLPRI
ncbi:hypothetical protein FHX74_000549 [Friedmanniella endophytica]|uniref:Type I phosphodiesterase / nucleotide pyrophosphatase n=1 Tax=Microlunatus kandeliicorticis TaxID=1759536 RepID=A0A7W3IPR0_9ACTN|nr:alkaline phosphatase family protein [Microlunatus kandeliicorticis]MBA8792955.1 hypothetical protein [Microlunatus kandeliicorticis]